MRTGWLSEWSQYGTTRVGSWRTCPIHLTRSQQTEPAEPPRLTPRLDGPTDPCPSLRLLQQPPQSRRPLFVAVAVGAILHAVLLFISIERRVARPVPATSLSLLPLRSLSLPPPPSAIQPPRLPKLPRIKRRKIPIPDPTPRDPEPMLVEPPEVDVAELDPLPLDLIGQPGPVTVDRGPVQSTRGTLWQGAPGVLDPVLLSKIEPHYPDKPRRAGIEARVILEAMVTREGQVENIKVLYSTAPGLGFEQAAEEAVANWKYRPAELDGQPIDVFFRVSVNFEIL